MNLFNFYDILYMFRTRGLICGKTVFLKINPLVRNM